MVAIGQKHEQALVPPSCEGSSWGTDRRKGTTRITRLVALLMTITAAFMLLAPAADADPSTEAAFVSRINQLRTSKGLAPLTVHAELTSIGRRWSAAMAAQGTISHNPNFAAQVTADWLKLGENVGMGGEIGSLFQAFVNSPSHYRNLVDPAFTHVGVGVVISNGTIFTAHQFMRFNVAAPAPAAPVVLEPPAPAPTPVAPAPAPAAPAPVLAPAPAPVPTAPTPAAAPVAPRRLSAPAATAAAPAPVAARPAAQPTAGPVAAPVASPPAPSVAPVELVSILEVLRALDQS